MYPFLVLKAQHPTAQPVLGAGDAEVSFPYGENVGVNDKLFSAALKSFVLFEKDAQGA